MVRITTSHLRGVLTATAILFASQAYALDKNGNFESKQEQDAFIAATLKKMAGEMNSQGPIPFRVERDSLIWPGRERTDEPAGV